MKGITHCLLASQISISSILFCLSFFWFIPLFISQHKLDGKCLMYTTGSWTVNQTNPDFMVFTDVRWGSESACNFNLFMGVLSGTLALFYIFWEALYFSRGIDNSLVDGVVASIITWVMATFTIIASLIITIGVSELCDSLTAPPSHITTCNSAESIHFLNDSTLDSSNFYTHLQLSQFGSWTVFLCWVVFGVLCIIKSLRHKREAAFLLTLGKERERLLESFSDSSL